MESASASLESSRLLNTWAESEPLAPCAILSIPVPIVLLLPSQVECHFNRL